MAEGSKCRLLAGPSAWAAQLSLFVVVLCSLVYKRHREVPQRDLNVWLMDVSKQIMSSGAAHICGLTFAILLAEGVDDSPRGSSECGWYFVLFSADTTLGVTVAISLHRYIVHRVNSTMSVAGAGRWFDPVGDCGQYGDPPDIKMWAVQMLEWVACTVAGRGACALFVFATRGVLGFVAMGLDAMFKGEPGAELFAVMVACPLGMNALQVWVQDTYLKWRAGGGGSPMVSGHWYERLGWNGEK